MKDKVKFSTYTKKLREAFPTWTKIRKDPRSLGAQFLSVIGLKLDEVEWLLNYAYEQAYIGTADIDQVDIVYKARIPNTLRPDMNYKFQGGSHVLYEMKNVISFLSPLEKATHFSTLQYETQFYIDYDSKFIYVRHPFGAEEKYPEGMLELTVKNEYDQVVLQENLKLQLHHVWNFFDEFGLLLNTPRLYGEKNKDYKQRILDVFRRPSNASYRGLVNGIARGLGLVHELQWDDGGKDIILTSPRVDKTTVMVDDEVFPEGYMKEDRSGRIKLLGQESYSGQTRVIRYIAGIELHELHNKQDRAFQEELYNIDGTATPLLQYYVRQIQDQVPIMWGQWKWDEGFWDVTDQGMSGYGCLPTVHDARFSGWKTYTPREA